MNLFSFIDIRLIKWNKNAHSYFSTSSNITSSVISVDLLDESGKEMKIEDLKKTIQIKISSNLSRMDPMQQNRKEE